MHVTTQSDGSQPQTRPLSTISRSSTNPVAVGSAEAESSHGDGQPATTSQPRTINVLLFGETAIGRRSVINLIARKEIAKALTNVNAYALQTSRYDIHFDDMSFSIFDTIDLDGTKIDVNSYFKTLEMAHELVMKLSASGGVHLLLFTMRGGRRTVAVERTYSLFARVICQEKVPLAFVFTGPEWAEEPEDRWRNQSRVRQYGFKHSGYACVTTVRDHTSGEDLKYTESQKRVRELLKSCCLKNEAYLPQEHSWLACIGKGMQNYIVGHRKPGKRDVYQALTQRCNLDPETARKIADKMERGNVWSSSEDDDSVGEGRSRDTPLAKTEGREETARSQDLDLGTRGRGDEPSNVISQDSDLGKWHGEPQIGSGVEMSRSQNVNLDVGKPDHEVGVVETVKSQDPDVIGKEVKWGERDHEISKKALTARKVKWQVAAGLRKANTPVKKHVNSETGTPINDIRSRLPCDLTGLVTRSGNHPFASGGFGDIYKGKLNTRGKMIDVAIKTTRVYLQYNQHLPKKMKQFRREITVWSKLEHPNVLPLLGTIRDPDTHPDIPAMVCPWVENGALSTFLERNNDLTVIKRFVLVDDVAHGLQYLHSQHVVHGDLSGNEQSNILVDGDGRACIADFGLSTLLTQLGGSTFATTYQAKGTMRWMAPELLDPEDDSQTIPTTQSDVYSFGSIMLQILTGSIPYHYLSRNEQVIFAIAKGTRPRRPNEETVTDQRWRFVERCWSPIDASKPRPSSDEIVEFTGKEFTKVMAAEL